MLELIFQGYIEWMYSLVLEIWNYVSSSLLDIMSLDLAYIRAHVPILLDIMGVLLAVGWALLLGNLVFQALKSMAAGLGFEGENPKLLFGRTFVFAFLLLASPQLCELGLNLTSRVIALLKVPEAIDVHLIDAGIFGNLTAGWLVVIVGDLFLMVQMLKLLLKIAEQYVVLSTLTVTAPLAFSMGGSGSTAPIFTGWCRMYGSMCLLMVTNMMFFKMLLSVMSAIPSGLDVIPWLVLISSITRVARKADDIITRIGLNPAMTGEKKGRSLPGMLVSSVLRGAASQVTKSVLKTAGGDGRGAAGVGRAAVGAAAGGLASGLFRPGRQGNTASTTRQEQTQNSTRDASSRQSKTEENIQRQGQPQQSSLVQNSGISSAPVNQADQFTKRTRNSAVEPGVHRGASYVQSQDISEGKQFSHSGTAGMRTGFSTAEKSVWHSVFNNGRSSGFGRGRAGGGGFSGGGRGSFGGGQQGGGFSGGSRGKFGGGSRTSPASEDTNTSRSDQISSIRETSSGHHASRGGGFTPSGGGGFRRKLESGTGAAGTAAPKSPGGAKHARSAAASAPPAVRNGQTRWTETRSTRRTFSTTERTAEIRSMLSRTGPAGNALQPRAVRQPAELLKSKKTDSLISGEGQILRTHFKPARQEPYQAIESDKAQRSKTPAVRHGPAGTTSDVQYRAVMPSTGSRLTKRERNRKGSAVKPQSSVLARPPSVQRYIPKQRGGDRRGK